MRDHTDWDSGPSLKRQERLARSLGVDDDARGTGRYAPVQRPARGVQRLGVSRDFVHGHHDRPALLTQAIDHPYERRQQRRIRGDRELHVDDVGCEGTDGFKHCLGRGKDRRERSDYFFGRVLGPPGRDHSDVVPLGEKLSPQHRAVGTDAVLRRRIRGDEQDFHASAAATSSVIDAQSYSASHSWDSDG